MMGLPKRPSLRHTGLETDYLLLIYRGTMAGDQPRKGRLNRGGRKPGSKNVVPLQVAEMVQNAMRLAGQHLQDGDTQGELQGMNASEAYLMAMALREPRSFMALVSKLMPTKLEGEVHVFEGAALVDRLQQGRALAAKQLEKANDEQRVH
jgi:hypothetical protein